MQLMRKVSQTCVVVAIAAMLTACEGSSTVVRSSGPVVDCTVGSGTYAKGPWVDAQQCPASGFCCEEFGQ